MLNAEVLLGTFVNIRTYCKCMEPFAYDASIQHKIKHRFQVLVAIEQRFPTPINANGVQSSS